MDSSRLLDNVKRAVKQLAEEAVTRRFVHQDSANISALCLALEAALTHRLQKRTFRSLWSDVTSADIITKLGRYYQPAADLSSRCQDIIAAFNLKSSSRYRNQQSGGEGSRWRHNLLMQYGSVLSQRSHHRYLWMRMALMEKKLSSIVEALVQKANAFYEPDSLLAHSVHGPILASLLAGPCALDYSRMKTPDYVWSDPTAPDLLSRIRITRSDSYAALPSHSLEQGADRNPAMENSGEKGVRQTEVFEYVSALHQDARVTLLYGKNNIVVELTSGVMAKGYLSLHQMADETILKWTPNDLVEGQASRLPAANVESANEQHHTSWLSGRTVYIADIACIHCHPACMVGGVEAQRVQFVQRDGSSLPPFSFSQGSGLFSFLATLETALLPGMHLEPPLWGQHKTDSFSLPWPVSKLTGAGHANSPEISSSGDMQSSHGRHIELDDLGPSLAGARQYNCRRRLERGCIFRILRTSETARGIVGSVDDPLTSSTGEEQTYPSLSPQLRQPSVHGSASPSHVDEEGGELVYTDSDSDSLSAMSNEEEEEVARNVTDRMKHRIKSRTFYGWLSYCRDMKIVQTHLSKLVWSVDDAATALVTNEATEQWSEGLTSVVWESLLTKEGMVGSKSVLMKRIFFGGIADNSLRKEVWPFLLGLFDVMSTPTQRTLTLAELQEHYESVLHKWIAVENAIKVYRAEEMIQCEELFGDMESREDQLEAELAFREKGRRLRANSDSPANVLDKAEESERKSDGSLSGASYKEELAERRHDTPEGGSKVYTGRASSNPAKSATSAQKVKPRSHRISPSDDKSAAVLPLASGEVSVIDTLPNACPGCQQVTAEAEPTVNCVLSEPVDSEEAAQQSDVVLHSLCPVCGKQRQSGQSDISAPTGGDQAMASTTSGPPEPSESSQPNGLTTISQLASTLPDNFSEHEVELWAQQLHKIDKDVVRCDRNYSYFKPANLVKLRNVLASYVWEHQDIGYIQGMCDLLAPLLVVFDDEVMAYGCFNKLMEMMLDNFPQGQAMDRHLSNMRLLLQVCDRDVFELMQLNGDYTHFYFAYRWFLLDLKRELTYTDLFVVWETIWSARQCCTSHFTLFLATSLVLLYRDVILENNMDFTEIIKFFNEMAEKHSVNELLTGARQLVGRLQGLLLPQ